MSIAPRRGEVLDGARRAGRAGDVDAERVGLALEPHQRLAAHRARPSGTSTASGPSGRSASTGPTTSGMTSPAWRTMTVSPGRTSLARTWSSLCSVALPTVTPPTNTGSSTANGVARPVRPIDTRMSSSFVVRSSGGNLKAMAQRGACDVEAELVALAEVVDLHDDAVDLVVEVVAVVQQLVAHGVHLVERVDDARSRGSPAGPASPQPLERLVVACVKRGAPSMAPSW